MMEIPFKAFANLPMLLEIYRKAAGCGCKVFLNGQTGNASVSYGDIDAAVYEQYRNRRYFRAFKYFNNFCRISGLSRKKWFPEEVKKMLSQTFGVEKQSEISPDDINPFINIEILNGYFFLNEINQAWFSMKKHIY